MSFEYKSVPYISGSYARVRFVDTVMRFGIGIVLTPKEEKTVAPIVRPCFAALRLANDYHSFDIEWEDEAKSRVVQVVRGYEKEFQRSANGFIADTNRYGSHLQEYL
ncbi:unnamed protein product [Penicillium nalgiovense]|nr:unnamed protein product [Penicillium nalgiovense]